MKTPRNFLDRDLNEQRWLTKNTWCAVCKKADLGLVSPSEYEEDGRIFVEGNCTRCGSRISSEIFIREATDD